MVIGEPVRELVTFSFWLKMALVAIGALVAVAFQRALRRHEQRWEDTLVHNAIDQGARDRDVPDLGLHHLPRSPDRV